MKTLIFIFTLIISVNLYSQSIVENNNEMFINDNSEKIIEITSFTYKVIDKKVFFNWKIKGEKDDCIFVIERSNDFVVYKSVGYVAGIGIEKNIELLYSYSDTIDFDDIAYYRIKQVKTDMVRYSDTKVVDNPNAMFYADFNDE